MAIAATLFGIASGCGDDLGSAPNAATEDGDAARSDTAIEREDGSVTDGDVLADDPGDAGGDAEVSSMDGSVDAGGTVDAELVSDVAVRDVTVKDSDDEDAGEGNTDLEDAVAAPFVDTGYFLHAYNATITLQSFRFQSPPPHEEHRSYFIGLHYRRAGDVHVARRAYFVFDVSEITSTPTSATLRIWGSNPHDRNQMSGAYESPDPSETVALFSVVTPVADVLRAPFDDDSVHTVDLPIWEDLGDGDVLGSRVYTVADENTDLIPNPNEDPGVDCSLSASSCGKWLEFELTSAALAEIADADGEWIFGMALTTIDPTLEPGATEKKEWVNNGILTDLHPDKMIDRFRAPEPQLIVTP